MKKFFRNFPWFSVALLCLAGLVLLFGSMVRDMFLLNVKPTTELHTSIIEPGRNATPEEWIAYMDQQTALAAKAAFLLGVICEVNQIDYECALDKYKKAHELQPDNQDYEKALQAMQQKSK